MPHGLPGDLCGLTATQAARLIHDGKLRPEALMDAIAASTADFSCGAWKPWAVNATQLPIVIGEPLAAADPELPEVVDGPDFDELPHADSNVAATASVAIATLPVVLGWYIDSSGCVLRVAPCDGWAKYAYTATVRRGGSVAWLSERGHTLGWRRYACRYPWQLPVPGISCAPVDAPTDTRAHATAPPLKRSAGPITDAVTRLPECPSRTAPA